MSCRSVTHNDIKKYDGICRRRQNADYRRLGPGGGGFNAAGYEEVLARLTVDQPGVRHRCIPDAAAAADHVSQLTKALAQQPFKVQARPSPRSYPRAGH